MVVFVLWVALVWLTVVSCVISITSVMGWKSEDNNDDDDGNLVMFSIDSAGEKSSKLEERKETERVSEWVRVRGRKENEGHLKWTVLPNWEMKSDDAMGDDNQGREQTRDRERVRENTRRRKKNVVYTIGDDEKTSSTTKRCCVCWSNLHMRIRCVDGCVEMCRETCTYAFQLVDREPPRERFVSFSMRRANEEKLSTQNQNIGRSKKKRIYFYCCWCCWDSPLAYRTMTVMMALSCTYIYTHLKGLLQWKEEKQTSNEDDNGRGLVFVRTNWISWINTWKGIDMKNVSMYVWQY